MPTVSENIAKWLQATSYNNIPQEVVDVAKRSIMDFIGVILAGSRQPVAQIVKKYVNEVNGKQQATVIGLGIKVSCAEAAFANGLLGHYLDYDDLLVPMPGMEGIHITAPILPAALAIGEKENKSGKEVIEAYILGCEITCKVGAGVDPSHSSLGWHPTATKGIFGATVAAGRLLGLNEEEMSYALGVAGSEAAGLRENFGTMTKSFHVGHAAADGVRTAMLAKLGFNSSKTIFEGKDGFCRVLSKAPKIDEITKNIGQPFCLPQVRLKLYPSCGNTHPAIEAMLNLVNRHNLHDISTENIEEIELKCDPTNILVERLEKPSTGLMGKFSLPFCLALALSEGEVTVSQFTDEKVKEPKIVALMEKVKIVPTPELRPTGDTARPHIVEITLKGGKKIVSERVDFPRGSIENPIPDEELFQKYRSCASGVLQEKEIEKSIELITNLEKVDDIGTLLDILTG